jgi:hypothetical protein
MEALDLEPLAADRVTECGFVARPLKLVGATSSPSGRLRSSDGGRLGGLGLARGVFQQAGPLSEPPSPLFSLDSVGTQFHRTTLFTGCRTRSREGGMERLESERCSPFRPRLPALHHQT